MFSLGCQPTRPGQLKDQLREVFECFTAVNIINKTEDIIVIHLLKASLSVYYFTTTALNFYLITKAEACTVVCSYGLEHKLAHRELQQTSLEMSLRDVMLVVTRTRAHCCDDSHERSCYGGEGVEISSSCGQTDRQVSAMVSVATRPTPGLPVSTYDGPPWGSAASQHENENYAGKSFFRWKSPRNCLQRFLGKILQ